MATYKCQVFAASRDRSKTSVKLVNNAFGDKTVWLNLRTSEDTPDFGSQRIVAEICRGLVGSGFHYELVVQTEDITVGDKGQLQVKLTKESLKSRWTKVKNAERDESISDDSARQFFASELADIPALAPVKGEPVADNQPF